MRARVALAGTLSPWGHASRGLPTSVAEDRRANRRTGLVMASPQQRHDPYKVFKFRVEIDGVTVAAFSEATGLESETAVIEYRTGADHVLRKLPGLTKYANIVLRRGITDDAELWN